MGKVKSRNNYALSEMDLQRRAEMKRQQERWQDRNYNSGNPSYQRKENLVARSSVRVGSEPQIAANHVNANMQRRANMLRSRGRIDQANRVENAMYNRLDRQSSAMDRLNRVTRYSKRRYN